MGTLCQPSVWRCSLRDALHLRPHGMKRLPKKPLKHDNGSSGPGYHTMALNGLGPAMAKAVGTCTSGNTNACGGSPFGLAVVAWEWGL